MAKHTSMKETEEDLKKIIKIQEKIIKSQKKEIGYYKDVSHYLFYETRELWSDTFRTKEHNLYLWKYSNSVWAVLKKLQKKGKKDVQK